MGLFDRIKRAMLNSSHREKGIMFSDEADENMEAAIKSAKESLPSFLEQLRHPSENMDRFAIKVGLKTNDDTLEHCWVSDISYENEIVKGKLSVQPNNVPGYIMGSQIKIHIDDISDWAYSVDGKFQGHYTTKCLLPQMPKQMRQQVMEIYGWDNSDL